MKKSNLIFKILALSIVVTAFLFFSVKEKNFKGKKAEAAITAVNSAQMPVTGMLKFSEQKGGKVKMELTIVVPGKPGQTVAVHFHEHGDCGDAGNNTHGHWNPTLKKHGKWGSAEYHPGDIGNIQLNARGRGKVTITSALWTIGGDEKTNILDKGVIVHAGVDDYTTQPTGNSGARIGCGIIMEKK